MYSVHSLLCGFFDKVFGRFIVSFRIYLLDHLPVLAGFRLTSCHFTRTKKYLHFVLLYVSKNPQNDKCTVTPPSPVENPRKFKEKPHKNCSRLENVTTGLKKPEKEPPAMLCIFVAHVP